MATFTERRNLVRSLYMAYPSNDTCKPLTDIICEIPPCWYKSEISSGSIDLSPNKIAFITLASVFGKIENI